MSVPAARAVTWDSNPAPSQFLTHYCLTPASVSCPVKKGSVRGFTLSSPWTEDTQTPFPWAKPCIQTHKGTHCLPLLNRSTGLLPLQRQLQPGLGPCSKQPPRGLSRLHSPHLQVGLQAALGVPKHWDLCPHSTQDHPAPVTAPPLLLTLLGGKESTLSAMPQGSPVRLVPGEMNMRSSKPGSPAIPCETPLDREPTPTACTPLLEDTQSR